MLKDTARSSPSGVDCNELSAFEEWTDYFQSILSPQTSHEATNEQADGSAAQSASGSTAIIGSNQTHVSSEEDSGNLAAPMDCEEGPRPVHSFNPLRPSASARSLSEWAAPRMHDRFARSRAKSYGNPSSSSQPIYSKRKRVEQCGCERLHVAAQERGASVPWSDDGNLSDEEADGHPFSRLEVDLERQRMLTERYESMLKNAVRKLDVAARLLQIETSKNNRYPRSSSDPYIKRQSRR